MKRQRQRDSPRQPRTPLPAITHETRTFSAAHGGEAGLESQHEVHSVSGLLCWLLSPLLSSSRQAGPIGGASAAGAKAPGADR